MPFSLFNRSPEHSILTVTLDGNAVCTIGNVPVEERRVIHLTSDSPVLSFVDSDGSPHNHDLSSVLRDGCSWISLSVRVHESFVGQADCLIHSSEMIDKGAFSRLEVKGIRFQPFYLPQCESSQEEFIGQGLFCRGLHFPGTITPETVSASCLCDFCRKSFRLQSFHAGFGNHAYFYCSRGLHTLVIDSFIEGAPAPLCHPDPDALSALESRLPNCTQCGGDFKYRNPLLCPHCRQPFIDFMRHPELRDKEYYGNYLYRESTQRWEEPNRLANPTSDGQQLSKH
jgi:hypothetical protein